MMKQFVLGMVGCLFLSSVFADTVSEIKQVFDTAMQDWNQGNMDAYIKIYAPSPDTIYVTHTIIHGFDAIKRNVVQRYTTAAKRGKLSFHQLEVKTLSPEYAMAIGQYQLVRSKAVGGNASGYFSCLFKHTKKGWKIIVDHSS